MRAMECDQRVVQRVSEIQAAGGPHAALSVRVMLDGRPERSEWMVLRGLTLTCDDGENVIAECSVMDLELNEWTVDVRHVCEVSKQ